MAEFIHYLDKEGLRKTINLIKKRTSTMYELKGSGIWADDYYLTQDEATERGINKVGLWQEIDGVWTQVTSGRVGHVYNVLNAFTTNDEFKEGAGHKIDAGMNIVIMNLGTTESPNPKWDTLSLGADLSIYQPKQLTTAIDVFAPTYKADTEAALPRTTSAVPVMYVADTPVKAVETLDIAAVKGTFRSAVGDLYEKEVLYRATVDGENIQWTKLGDQETIEGAIHLLASVVPNTRITEAEIEEMFAEE